MRSDIKLGRIFGIEIGLHYSWFIIAALIVFSLVGHFHQVDPGRDIIQIWIAALLTAVLFFACLLLHELSHSLVAQSYGLKVTGITLFALGGVSQIQDDANDAKTEFWVAIAGPIASMIIGFVWFAVAAALGWRYPAEPRTGVSEVLVWLGYINASLGIFNMIPGFPLDGGRVFRSMVRTGGGNMKCQICGKKVEHLTPRDQIGMCPECIVVWDLCRAVQTGFWEDSADVVAERILAQAEQVLFAAYR